MSRGQPVRVGQGSRVGPGPVHQTGKLPVVGVEPLEEVGFEIPLGILVRSKEGNTVPGIIEVAAVEMGLRPHCRGVDDRRRVILDGDHGVLDIRPVEGLEGLGEVLCHSVIVNHQAVVLLGEHLLVLMGEPPVPPGPPPGGGRALATSGPR